MKNSKKKNGRTQSLPVIPAILALGFVPLIVYMMVYDSNYEDVSWFPLASLMQVDFFHAWKSVAIMAVGAIALAILIYRYLRGRQPLPWCTPFVLLAAYGVLVLMSALLSRNRFLAFRGTYQVMQPVGDVLAYIVLCYYAFCLAQDERKLYRVLAFSSVGAGLMLVLGIFQYAGLDFFRSTPGRYLITSPSHWHESDLLQFTMPERVVYCTLYNPDFLSFYFGLLVLLLLPAVFAVKKIWQKLLCLFGIAAGVVCLIGAGAASGYLAPFIGLLVMLLVLSSRRKKMFAAFLAAMGSALVLFIAVSLNTGLGASMETLFLGNTRSDRTDALQAIRTGDDGIYFDLLGGKQLKISYELDEQGYVWAEYAGDGADLPSSMDYEQNISFIDDADYGQWAVFAAEIGGTKGVGISFDGHLYYFSHSISEDDNTYYYYNTADRFVKTGPIKSANLFRDDALSGRGNIWNKTLPLLSERIFLGSGSGTFQLAFPQDDYVYKEYRGLLNVYTVKAHNWFLQEWVETGLIGTLCLFGFYLWYFIRSIRIYRRADMHDPLALIGFGIFVGTVAYMAAGLANDSNVCTAPVFYVMLGLGMAANRMLEGTPELKDGHPSQRKRRNLKRREETCDSNCKKFGFCYNSISFRRKSSADNG